MEQNQPDASSPHIAWHPAFIEALQMELQEYQDALEFHPEYQLTSEPLRIDCVVIKKAKDAVIKKNIAVIFREWNLLEYKSPGDYVSVADFYKVYGYACLYTSFKQVPITSLTVSFIESHYPKKLLDHLKNERGYTVAETGKGIYTVSGDILPIQVIDSRKLPAEENLWLKNLSNELGFLAFRELRGEVTQQGMAIQIGAYWNAIVRANPGAVMEAIKMGDALTIEKVFEEVGWTSKWEARGRAEGEARGEARGRAEGEERKAFAIAQNLVNLGIPIETVVSATQLDPEKVKSLKK
jgi:hypothetical protein